MDNILEKLKGRRTSGKDRVIAVPKVNTENEGMGIQEILLVDNFLRNLNPDKTRVYLKNHDRQTVRKLLMADSYVSRSTDEGIYVFLEDDSISVNAWATYIAVFLQDTVMTFARSFYIRNPRLERRAFDAMLEQTIREYLDFDLSVYQERLVTNDEHNLLVLCDCLLALSLGQPNLKDIYKSVQARLLSLKELMLTYRIDIQNQGLDSLHIFQFIPELKYGCYHES